MFIMVILWRLCFSNSCGGQLKTVKTVAGILETLLQEEAVKEKIVDSAVSHYRVASRDTAKKHIEEMLYAMYNDLNIVES